MLGLCTLHTWRVWGKNWGWRPPDGAWLWAYTFAPVWCSTHPSSLLLMANEDILPCLRQDSIPRHIRSPTRRSKLWTPSKCAFLLHTSWVINLLT